jgi:hypothetical protein
MSLCACIRLAFFRPWVWVRSFGFIFLLFDFCKLCANGLDYSHAINKRKQGTMTLYTHSDHRDGKEIRFSSHRMKHFSSFQGHANQTSSIAKWLAIIDTEDRRQKEFALRKEKTRSLFSQFCLLEFLSGGALGCCCIDKVFSVGDATMHRHPRHKGGCHRGMERSGDERHDPSVGTEQSAIPDQRWARCSGAGIRIPRATQNGGGWAPLCRPAEYA